LAEDLGPRLNCGGRRLTIRLQRSPARRIWIPGLHCGGRRLNLGLQHRPWRRIWAPD
jgi:hypothetical protein